VVAWIIGVAVENCQRIESFLRLIDIEACEVVLDKFNMILKANFNESNIQWRDDGCLPS